MRSLLSFTLLSSLLSILLLLPHSETVLAKQNIDERSFSDITKQILVEAYQFAEYPRALKGLFANIGPDGSKAPGVPAGVVLASPSTENPNYFYTWIRDSSLVFKYIVDRWVSGRDHSLRHRIEDWIETMGIMQQIPNLSGNLTTGGLGEPKFEANLTAFTGDWGRPQRDGPALRATVLITFANKLLSQNENSYIEDTIWPILELDLNYVAASWNITGFDLWEEVAGESFFTSAVQHRALREGITFATALGDPSGTVAEWSKQADNLLCFLQGYWSDAGFIVSNVSPIFGTIRTGIDANSVLGSIHTFDPEAGCDARTFQPCSDKALASLKVYVDSFRDIYAINAGVPSNEAVATGRYASDVYFDGNPWYLTTFAVAEQLYRALQVWNKEGQGITITDISLDFFKQFDSSVTTGTIAPRSLEYNGLTKAIKKFADGFIFINAKYTPFSGALSEQYSRANGTQLSAVDLTWSYASALTVFDARKGLEAESWGAKDVTVPTVCDTNYGPTSSVIFNVNATTVVGENVYLTGNLDVLHGWSDLYALGPLNNDGTYPIWSIEVTVPANTAFLYKFLRKNNGTVTWESDPNRHNTTAAEGGSITLWDEWR